MNKAEESSSIRGTYYAPKNLSMRDDDAKRARKIQVERGIKDVRDFFHLLRHRQGDMEDQSGGGAVEDGGDKTAVPSEVKEGGRDSGGRPGDQSVSPVRRREDRHHRRSRSGERKRDHEDRHQRRSRSGERKRDHKRSRSLEPYDVQSKRGRRSRSRSSHRSERDTVDEPFTLPTLSTASENAMGSGTGGGGGSELLRSRKKPVMHMTAEDFAQRHKMVGSTRAVYDRKKFEKEFDHKALLRSLPEDHQRVYRDNPHLRQVRM